MEQASKRTNLLVPSGGRKAYPFDEFLRNNFGWLAEGLA
jgi:hypothetical protein